MNTKELTDRIDAVVTNKWTSLPIFLLLLYFVFWTTFKLGYYPMGWIESLVGWFGSWMGAVLPAGWFKDLLLDGIIAGVGSVLVFFPIILILFFFISLLEDCGYMARAAFIVDKFMHLIGLHGTSFMPFVMGFGCNVPAIMSTRGIESRKGRILTIALIPFMSCSGRLPVFILLAGAFFPQHATLALLCTYLLGILLAVLTALAMKPFVRDDVVPVEEDLPEYHLPTVREMASHTWEKSREYLQKIGTTILVGSIVIWCLGYFPRSEGRSAEYQQEHSALGYVGKAVAPALEPLGFSWKMDIGLISGVVSKELIVSSLGVMYAGDASGSDTTLQAALSDNVTLPAAVAFMIFVLLYFPCIATFVAIKNETGKWAWAIGICAYTMLVAWIVSFVGFHITSALLH